MEDCAKEKIFFVVISLLSSALGAPTLAVDTAVSNYGTTETLKCTDATYSSGNSYAWEKDGVAIFADTGELTTTGKYSESIDGTTFKLVINNIDVSDEGNYICSHDFDNSNTLDLQVESQGTATAKLSSSNLVEVTFKQIYPNSISAAITCDTNIVAGSFVSSVADRDRFTSTWQSTNTFSTVPSSCSASVTLRTTFSAGITFATGEPPGTSEGDKKGEIAGGTVGGTVGGGGCLFVGGYIIHRLRLFLNKVWYVFLTLDRSCILGATIGACVVTAVTCGGPADGKLKVGFQIHKIDGKSLTGKDQNEIEAMIKDTKILTLHVSKVGSTDTSEVKLNCKRGEQLGFDCENLAIVTAVNEGGKAYKKLKKGDRILSINGKSTTGKSIGDVNKQLNIPPTVMELTIKRAIGMDKKHVTLDFREKASSGIAIKKEKEDIVVSTIEPESAAAISGEIQEQDCILSVNGVSTTGMKDADIKKMLTFSIILKVTKDVTLKELDPDKDGSFGFETFLPSTSTSVTVNNQTAVTTVTPERLANVVKSVTTNGPADLHGIKPGDTIVSINNEETKGKSHQEIKAMLDTFGTSISLKIAENDKPNQTNGRGGYDIEMGYVNPRPQDSGSSPQ